LILSYFCLPSILAFFSYLFLGEQFGPQGFLGTFFILAGVYLSATNREGKVENVESVDVSSLSAVNSGMQRGEGGGK
jgi:drug/metabolite transporter (DMT)-like permease